MNCLLLSRSELDGSKVELSDRRARHVLEVLRKKPGDTISCGVLGEGRGQAIILSTGCDRVSLELDRLSQDPAPDTHLSVAMPRPKGLSRLLFTASSLGIARLDLISAFRVEKSYFLSDRLEPGRIQEELILGAEQGGTVHLPRVTVWPHFSEWLETSLRPQLAPPRVLGLVLHPYASATLQTVGPQLLHQDSSEQVLILGPEGGFTEGELRAIVSTGAHPIRLEAPILRTEAAMVFALAQLRFLLSERNEGAWEKQSLPP